MDGGGTGEAGGGGEASIELRRWRTFSCPVFLLEIKYSLCLPFLASLETSPFRFGGILHRGTAKFNPKSLEIENEELKRKNEALEKENKAFQAKLSILHIKIV